MINNLCLLRNSHLLKGSLNKSTDIKIDCWANPNPPSIACTAIMETGFKSIIPLPACTFLSIVSRWCQRDTGGRRVWSQYVLSQRLLQCNFSHAWLLILHGGPLPQQPAARSGRFSDRLKISSKDFLVCPVVKSPYFHCRGCSSVAGWGTKIPHVMWCSKNSQGLATPCRWLS